MKFGIVCSTYNHIEGLRRMVLSALQFDKIIIVDGKWKDYDGIPISTDGTKSFCKTVKNIEYYEAPNLLEYQKRNVYFEHCQDLNFALMLDDDEFILELDYEKFKQSCENSIEPDKWIYPIRGYHGIDTHLTHDQPRLYYQPYKMRHLDRHNEIFVNNNPQWKSTGKLIGGILLKHDKSLRDPARNEYDKAFYEAHPIR